MGVARLVMRRALGAQPGVVAALIVASPLALVARACARASWAPLGRDQGIFQYAAWAARQGEALYRDVRDVNGPVVAMVHLFFQLLGGEDERRFRVLDLLVTGVVFALAGACIPSCVPREGPSSGAPAWTSRASWALAAWVALSAQYLVYGFWDTAQRESFLGWFVLASVALQAACDAPDTRAGRAMLFAAGAASVAPWFGKPTFAVFTLAQLAALALLRGPPGARARSLGVFALGGLAGAAAPIAFLQTHGDLGAWARITLVDVPAMYRFIWPRSPAAILSMPGYGATSLLALLTTAGLFALVTRGWLPRRAIPVAALPTLGLASVLVQAKGFPYHFHPVTLGTWFGWLVALAALASRARTPKRQAAIAVAAALVAVRAARFAIAAPYPPVPEAGADEDARLAAFERVDFSPRALRAAADFVAARTGPEDRVQTYGMDPYVLFLARRRSATPYVYAYDLDVAAAQRGSFDPDGARPTPAQSEIIRAMGEAHARDLLERLAATPPAAFVFVDRSPLMTHEDAVTNFAVHCPEAAAWVTARYREAAEFHGVRVWLRADRPDARAP